MLTLTSALFFETVVFICKFIDYLYVSTKNKLLDK